MKRVLLIYNIFSDDESTKSIHRKMLEQSRSLERMGAVVDMISLHSKGIQSDGRLVLAHELYKVKSRNNFQIFDFYKSLKKLENLSSYDVFYIRYSPTSLNLLSFLKYLKKIKPDCKIFLDLPNYPFLGEYHGLKKLLVQMLGYRNKYLKNYITNIIAVGNEKEIWGIPVVNIKNAIDPESYKLRSALSVDNVIRLVMVSTFWDWQGIDRLVQGMISYMSILNHKYTIYLTLIGEGPELSNIRDLAETPIVKENIFFYPALQGNELNQFFDQADLAVGTLAVDRKGLEECSALMHRQYGARGIPFIYAGYDNSFDNNNFILQLPLKEAETPFDQIVNFYEKIKNNPVEYSPESIKSKVHESLSWESQLRFLLS
jgi:glycosyltransferase involved in cell wall biosynthesis